MKITKSEMECNLAHAWVDGHYTYQQAQQSAELRDLDFNSVKDIYGCAYEQEQCANEGYYYG